MDDFNPEIEPSLISVALCTYNGGKFIEKQLQSILSQTYGNLEVIIVDDQSTDNTVAILGKYQKADHRIKLYENPKNLGFNKNFERAIGLSTGEFIAISDQDDIWEKEKIAKLHKHIADRWVIFSNSDLIDENEQPLGKKLVEEVDLDQLSHRSFLFINHVTGHTSLFRREFLKYYLPIPEAGYYDWWMGFIAAYHGQLVFLDQVLTRHRVHSQSVVQQTIQSHFDKKARNRLNYKLVNQHLNNFKEYKFLKEKDRAFLRQYEAAYISSLDKFSFKLYWFHLKHFDEIHLNKRNKSFLSKINFIRKISGPVNQ